MTWSFVLAASSFAVSMAALGLALGEVAPKDRVVLGIRGEHRAQVLANLRGVALMEPAVRQVAAWIRPLLPARVTRAVDEALSSSGNPLGLAADELIGGMTLSAAFAGILGGAICFVLGGSEGWALPCACAGAAAVPMRLRDAKRRRAKETNRGLPPAIDLVALCMSAGLDFPGALRFVVEAPGPKGLVQAEFEVVLRELVLGHTRAEALRGLERRLPYDAVRGFVAAVVQSETKGHSLVDVLRVQADVLRARRGVLAEEAAARAGVLMVLPLMLLLCSILLLLFGPFVVKGGL